MPLTRFQKEVFALLKSSRNPESYVAGGTAILRGEDTHRYSSDIDFFHDTDESVSEAFTSDSKVLMRHGYQVDILVSQPSFYRALLSKNNEHVRLEWVRDTSFRFFPVIDDPDLGYRLHDVDLAINKCIALANRSEVRDVLDITLLHAKVLSLAGCCWAACGKDPGFTPDLILEMIQRHAGLSPDLLRAESLARPIDPVDLKKQFGKLLDETRRALPLFKVETLGAVFVDSKGNVVRDPTSVTTRAARPHFGTVRGSWPRIP